MTSFKPTKSMQEVQFVYRIAGIFRGGGGGGVKSSWLSSEPRNIYPRMISYRGYCYTCARWAWFRHYPTTNVLPRITTNPSIHENFTPRKIPAIRYVNRFTSRASCTILGQFLNCPYHPLFPSTEEFYPSNCRTIKLRKCLNSTIESFHYLS